MEHTELRSAVPSDAGCVADLLIRSRREFLPYAPMRHEPHEVRDWIAKSLIPSGGVYLAERGKLLVGIVAVSRINETSWIDQLYVLPGYTHHGIGRALLELAHELLEPPVRLFTFQENSGARRFYERHGYRPARFRDGSENEEQCPDVLYEFRGEERAR